MTSISIIIPSYNYANYIEECLDSVYTQISPDDEIIIIDDGSTDKTRQIVEAHTDGRPQVQYHHQTNAGVSTARNHGLRLAMNDYVMFLDADDQIINGGLSALREAARKHSESAIIIGSHITFDQENRIKEHLQSPSSKHHYTNFFDYLISKRFSIANGGSAIIKTSVAKQYCFPEHLSVSEDICFFAWILANHRCMTIQTPIVLVRKHSDSLRNQIKKYEASAEQLPDTLFDRRFLGEQELKHKQQFQTHILLSLFRAQLKSNLVHQARANYLRAIRRSPKCVFKTSYTIKFLRSFLWKQAPAPASEPQQAKQ